MKFPFAAETDLLNSINNTDSKLFIELGTDKNEKNLFEGDKIIFYLVANQDCNIILLRINTKGETIVLFPNKSHPGYNVTAGSKYKIPGLNMEEILIDGPGGIERIKAIATTRDDFFQTLPESYGDFPDLKSPKIFLEKLKTDLKILQKDEWATASIEFSVEGSVVIPSGTPGPSVKPDISNILKYDQSSEYYAQGAAYYEQGKYDKAIEYFSKVVKTSPNVAFGYYSLGLSYQAKGAFKEALEYYKKCINQSVKERDCYIRLGEIYDETKNKKEAYLRYKKALRLTQGYEKINKINPSDTGPKKIYELEIKCKDKPGDKEKL